MTTQSYRDGFHTYLFPSDPRDGSDDADWQQGYDDACEMAKQVRAKPTFTARLTDDGTIDMFVVGPDGIPVARIKEPTQTVEEALAMAREWVESQEEED